jgi:hypothetical protein
MKTILMAVVVDGNWPFSDGGAFVLHRTTALEPTRHKCENDMTKPA